MRLSATQSLERLGIKTKKTAKFGLKWPFLQAKNASLIFLQIFYMFLHVFEDIFSVWSYAVPVCDCMYPAMVERLGKFISLRIYTIAK